MPMRVALFPRNSPWEEQSIPRVQPWNHIAPTTTLAVPSLQYPPPPPPSSCVSSLGAHATCSHGDRLVYSRTCPLCLGTWLSMASRTLCLSPTCFLYLSTTFPGVDIVSIRFSAACSHYLGCICGPAIMVPPGGRAILEIQCLKIAYSGGGGSQRSIGNLQWPQRDTVVLEADEGGVSDMGGQLHLHH